jgi:PIN domain nuclease of toxin-antitoxin system
VETLLRDEADPPRISALNLAEVLDILVRHQGWPAGEVEEKLRWLTLGGLEIVAVDERAGLSAGRLHAAHYHRVRRPLSLADCVGLATALALGERLATSDPALIAAARDETCPVVILLDARGQRPSVQSQPTDG